MLDRQGLTEEEFLKNYDPSKFDRPSVTVDVFAYNPKAQTLILIKRGGHPFLGKWALPGGFLEKDETAEEGGARELFEETGVKVRSLKQLPVFSNPKRDPRTRIITVPFVAFSEDIQPKAGDDADMAAAFKIQGEVLEEKNGEETGRIKLSRGDEVIMYMYKKSVPAVCRPCDPVFTAGVAGKIAGDHASIIACGYDYIKRITAKRHFWD